MNKQQVLRFYKNGIIKQLYKQEVIKRIRKVYSLDDECAILRQMTTKPSEFEEYNNTIESIKSEVKNEINELLGIEAL